MWATTEERTLMTSSLRSRRGTKPPLTTWPRILFTPSIQIFPSQLTLSKPHNMPRDGSGASHNAAGEEPEHNIVHGDVSS